MDSRLNIAIFAKAPIAGFAKTRLIPRLGAKGAADLQRVMIERTVQTAVESRLGTVSVWCAPDSKNDFFAALAADYPVELRTQSGTNLGARMLNTFETLTDSRPVILIGSDCPMLQASHLHACATALQCGHDVVFLPTEDGGYALVAAAKPWPELFCAMPWGSSAVMSETRLRANRLALRISEPAILWDVDRPEDCDRAAALGLFEA